MGRLLTAKQPSGKTEWETPWELVRALAEALDIDAFSLDPAARVNDHKADYYYGPDQPREDHRDGLAAPWFGAVFVNPPYGRGIGKWPRKAFEEVTAGRCQLVAALLPSNTSTRWWHRYVMTATEILILERRVTFVGQPSGAPFDNVIVIWRRYQLQQGRLYVRGWDWKGVQEAEAAAGAS